MFSALRCHVRSNIVGYAAIVLVFGGTSYAAVALPANSVTSVQVRDHSLLAKDFKSGQLIRGKRGSAGVRGPAGANGSTGAPGAAGARGPVGDTGRDGAAGQAGPAGETGRQGARGPSDAFGVRYQDTPLAFGLSDQAVGALALPEGAYMIVATATVFNTGGPPLTVRCSLSAAMPDETRFQTVTIPEFSFAAITIQTLSDYADAGDASLACHGNTLNGVAGGVVIQAMQTEHITETTAPAPS